VLRSCAAYCVNNEEVLRWADVDELAWREALVRAGGPDNPDRLWPVLATGMGDLLQREAAQRAALDEHQARLEQVARGTRELATRQRTALQQRLEAIKRREVRQEPDLVNLLHFYEPCTVGTSCSKCPGLVRILNIRHSSGSWSLAFTPIPVRECHRRT